MYQGGRRQNDPSCARLVSMTRSMDNAVNGQCGSNARRCFHKPRIRELIHMLQSSIVFAARLYPVRVSGLLKCADVHQIQQRNRIRKQGIDFDNRS